MPLYPTSLLAFYLSSFDCSDIGKKRELTLRAILKVPSPGRWKEDFATIQSKNTTSWENEKRSPKSSMSRQQNIFKMIQLDGDNLY
jgi:hypothetical protein